MTEKKIDLLENRIIASLYFFFKKKSVELKLKSVLSTTSRYFEPFQVARIVR